MPRFVLRRPWVTTAFLTLVLVAPALAVGQEAPKNNSQADELVSRIVVRLLERGHLARPTINDEISKRWFSNYLEALDPLKYNFLKADIDEFRGWESELDDRIQKGDLTVAQKIIDRFKERAKSRLDDATAILAQTPDFTIDESIVDDPELLDWPADAAEAKDRLRKLIKYDLLRSKILGEKPEESVKRLGIRYRDRWRLYRDLDSSEMLEFYLTSMAMAVDPHSGYMNGKTFEDMVGQQLHLTLDGIGASLSVEDGYPIVKDIVPGGAADKDGRLQIDDKIIGLVNDDGSKEDFVEKKLNDVVRKIRGPRDTKVRIMVQPANSKEVKVYELTRAKIELVESRAKARVIDHKVEGREEPLKLGIIDLPSFYGDTEALGNGDPNATSATADCRKILDDFKKQKVDVVLMDLRGNPGGLLIEACSLSGLFIDEGPVVQIRENAGVKPMGDDVAGTAWDGPLAVVIDKTSASASEIFAGVIKDYSRGLIIGDSSTFGKGTVQTLVPLNSRLGIRGDQVPNLGALKLTIQQFYRPDGASTQMKGVESDVHIPSTLDHLDLGETKLDSALKFDQIPALPHDQYNRAPADLIAQLIQRSEARRGQHEKFREDARYLQKLIERKKRHEISLNEEKFRAEVRAEKDEEEENRNGRRRPSKREIWESNHYNDEILSILGDYVTLGSRVLIAAPVRAGANAAEPPALMP